MEKRKTIQKSFLIDLIQYFISRVFSVIKYIIFILTSITTVSKKFIVQNLFWGRTNMYRNAFQLFILFFTVLIGISGVTNQFNLAEAKSSKSEYLLKNSDISLVGNSSDLDYNPELVFGLEQIYTVQSGDNLEIVAKKIIQNEINEYGGAIEMNQDRIKRKMDMIRYLNNLLDQNPVLKTGQELKIFFGIDGIVYKTQQGDTIKKISEKFKVGEQDIVDANTALIEDFLGGDSSQIKLETNSNIFVPTADLSTEIATRISDKKKLDEQNRAKSIVTRKVDYSIKINSTGNFMNPLASSDCAGYRYQRGFRNSHKGVDLSKLSGCTIVAADSGVVQTAGYTSGGGGNTVVIKHSNGFTTIYAHLARVYVRPGDNIAKGTPIGYMGRSGYATGVHLHLGLVYNGNMIDPARYISY